MASQVLKGNALGDPSLRELPVYLPPSFGRERGRRYPVIYFLPGFTGGGVTALGRHPWKENLAERFDRLIADGRAREAVLVIADCFTAFGGSQYLNSEATGRYEDHVADELVAFVDDKFPTVRSALGRGLMGTSSGGFGALSVAMRRPGVFGHAVCHSGDMLFEQCYAPDFLKTVAELDKRGGSLERLVRDFRASRTKSEFPHAAVNTLGMAACYSPDPRARVGFELPFDAATGELIPRVWRRWKAFDPVGASGRHVPALKALRTLFFDAGRRDEFHLHLGARALSRELKRLGVRHVHEEHELGHMDLQPRYERSLPMITARLASR